MQAPHCDVSQPICVPVIFRFSRRNSTRRTRSSTSPAALLPFTVMVTLVIDSPNVLGEQDDNQDDDREGDQPPDIGAAEKAGSGGDLGTFLGRFGGYDDVTHHVVGRGFL